jgi:hypothetical protein
MYNGSQPSYSITRMRRAFVDQVVIHRLRRWLHREMQRNLSVLIFDSGYKTRRQYRPRTPQTQHQLTYNSTKPNTPPHINNTLHSSNMKTSCLLVSLAAAVSAVDIRLWVSSSACQDSGAAAVCYNQNPNVHTRSHVPLRSSDHS